MSTDDNTPDNVPEVEPSTERRNFLVKSAALLTVMGATVGAGIGQAAASPAAGLALDRVVTHAATTGNMIEALQMHGQDLHPETHRLLLSLNGDDLASIRNLKVKLDGLHNIAKDTKNVNGIFGM